MLAAAEGSRAPFVASGCNLATRARLSATFDALCASSGPARRPVSLALPVSNATTAVLDNFFGLHDFLVDSTSRWIARLLEVDVCAEPGCQPPWGLYSLADLSLSPDATSNPFLTPWAAAAGAAGCPLPEEEGVGDVCYISGYDDVGYSTWIGQPYDYMISALANQQLMEDWSVGAYPGTTATPSCPLDSASVPDSSFATTWGTCEELALGPWTSCCDAEVRALCPTTCGVPSEDFDRPLVQLPVPNTVSCAERSAESCVTAAPTTSAVELLSFISETATMCPERCGCHFCPTPKMAVSESLYSRSGEEAFWACEQQRLSASPGVRVL